MKIGIIGSGVVAQTLGSGFLKHGYEVMLGTRSASKLDEWRAGNPGGKVGGFDETAAFGDAVVLAVHGTASESALTAAGSANLAGKLVIDATNPISEGAPVAGVLGFFTTMDKSLMESLQEAFPDAHLVKAFNSVGSPQMVNPEYAEGKPTMFICGNDEGAKATTTAILEQFGWDVADMGVAAAARAIEPLCMLWCIQGFLRNEWTHAFKMLHKA